jgi:glycosyltransferase involved in cell wall biosynthesis
MFWWKDFPVGQALDRGVGMRSVVISDLAEHSIKPDVLALAKQTTERESSESPHDAFHVSIVICTRDRPDALACCLARLAKQTRVPDEVIVVDNASQDERTRVVTANAGKRYIREDRPGLDFARNAGIRAASGDIIAYLDDDVCPHPRWLQRMLGAFDDPRIMAVTGLVFPAELETAAQRHFEKFWSFGRGYRRIDYDHAFFTDHEGQGCPTWEIGAGASMAFRREIFDRIGFFDERLDVGQAGCSGDSEYWHRILTQAWICRYEPSAVVFHFHRRELASLSKQIFYYMRGHAAALLVQFERSRRWGNLRRVFITLPCYYAKRVARLYLEGRRENDLFLYEEIRGYISGLAFYFRTRHNG